MHQPEARGSFRELRIATLVLLFVAIAFASSTSRFGAGSPAASGIGDSAPPPVAQCSDTRDNDGDALVDMRDPGCSSSSDNDERNTTTPPQCSDTRDNDGDSLVDMADPGCSSPSDNDERNTTSPPPPQCSDTRDNDGDALVDMRDPGCSSPSDNDETNAAPPPQGRVNCLVSNRTQWSLRGTNCAYGTELRFTNQQFRCNRPLSDYGRLPLRLVWNFTGNPDFGDQGHLDFVQGCRGDGNSDTIDVIVQSNADGVRFGAAGGAGKFRGAGPTDIQITGNFDCGPLGNSLAHQDGWQFHPDWRVARLDIVNGTSGNWEAGTSTCIGAGGAIFFSYFYDVDVYGGRYVTCNKGYFGNSSSTNLVVDAGFRNGRVDGSDPKCVPPQADGYRGDACRGDPAKFVNTICERWNLRTKQWEAQPPRPM